MVRPQLRRLTGADLPVLAAEVDRARAAGDFAASADPEAEWFLKSVEVDPSLVVGAFEAGRLVGLASGEFKVVIVRPDRRREGIGRMLVEAAAAAERARSRAELILSVLPGDDDGQAFLAAAGLSFHSILWDLTLERDAVTVAADWPPGVLARPFDRTRDLDPWVSLFNAAFADHATPLQLDPSFVLAGFNDPAIADTDTELLEDRATGELVGFCATSPIRRDGVVAHGEIWTIGVRPGRQGHGLGRQLLRWGISHLRELGAPDVELSVNGRNERALGLYESEGFIRSRTRERWARPAFSGSPVTGGAR